MKKKLKIALFTFTAVLSLIFLVAARTAIGNVLRGRVHLPKKYIGEVLTMEDGQKYKVFRILKVDSKDDDTDGWAVFKVRFKFKNLSVDANKKLSIIPAPFLMGMEGFREKNWTINEKKNYFQGIYQFSSVETAERYPDTFIFKAMVKRAESETVSYEIIPNTELSKYLSNIREK